MRTPIPRKRTRAPIVREAIAREADANDSAPWSPVPLFVAREFVRKNEDATLEVVFPTVYEEDRTAKLKDLITAQASGAITHQRMADQIAKELGFEEYDYEDELEAIKKEMTALPEGILGVADQIAGASGDTGQGNGMGSGDGGFGGVAAKGIKTDQPFTQQHRADLSGTAQAKFRKQQRQSQRRVEAAIISLTKAMRESYAELAGEIKKLKESR